MHIRTVHGETPNTVNTSVVRTRRYLTGREVEKLMEAARKHGRYGHRDATMTVTRCGRHGVVPSLSMRALPPALDIADDGLTALVDVDVLHRDLLLAFAAVAIERIEQSRIGAGELVGLAQSFPSALEGLVADHGPPVAFHRRVMECDKLGSDHALRVHPWLDAHQRIDRRMAFPPDFFRV